MLNSIIIHGRLTADPELRQTASGVNVCSFTVAVERSFPRNDEKTTDFFNCTAWRGLADTISKYFAKGKEIVVQGSMQSEKYEDKDGNNRIAWKILANSIDFCGSKSENSPTISPTNSNLEEFRQIATDDGDLPF